MPLLAAAVPHVLGRCLPQATLAFEDSRDGDAWMPAGHAATRLTDLVEGFLATQISIKAAEATAAQAQVRRTGSRPALLCSAPPLPMPLVGSLQPRQPTTRSVTAARACCFADGCLKMPQ